MSRPQSSQTLAAFTLIEVLASLVLLSLIAIFCAPLIQQSLRWLQPRPQPDLSLQFELSRLASQVVSDPRRFELEINEDWSGSSMAWPDAPDQGTVLIEPVPHRSELDANAAPNESTTQFESQWIRFSSNGIEVLRWVPRPTLEHDSLQAQLRGDQ